MIEEKEAERLFSLLDLKLTPEMIYNLLIREVVLTPALLPTLIMPASLIKDDNNRSLSSALSADNTTLLVRPPIRTCHEPNRFSVVAHYIILSTVAQTVFVSF